MADYLTTDTELTSVANAIRTKGGTNAQLEFPSGFVSAINDITTGGGSSDRYVRPSYPMEMIRKSIVAEGYDPSQVGALATVNGTMRIEIIDRDYILDTLTRDDTGASISYTEVTPLLLGAYRAYEFTMPDADVTYTLYYDD